jgi:hypothetical protein
MMHSRLHGAAYCLNPEYRLDTDLESGNECFDNLLEVGRRGGTSRDGWEAGDQQQLQQYHQQQQ